MRRGVVRIQLEGPADQPQPFMRIPSLQLDDPEKVQGVEIVRRQLENAAIQAFGLRQAPLLMQGEGLLKLRRGIEGLALSDGAIP